MRSFLAVLAVGLVALVAVGLTQRSSLVYSLGVAPSLHAAQVAPGTPACQGPIRVPDGAAFDRVGVALDTGRVPPSRPVRVEVREARGGRLLARGHVDGGYAPFVPGRSPEHVVDVGRVQTDAPLKLCVANDSPQAVVVMGQAGLASPTTSATLAGKPISPDLAFTLRSNDRSLLALLPDIARRAAAFRAGWVTPGVYLALALAIVLGAPLALTRGLARAGREDQRSSVSTSRQ